MAALVQEGGQIHEAHYPKMAAITQDRGSLSIRWDYQQRGIGIFFNK
jgi:hypothetical protein